MKKIIKKHKTKFLMFACVLFGGILVVSAETVSTIFASDEVSYDNSTSELESTNVQDAIDELYELYNATPKGTSPSDLKDNVVTTGAGLYADSVESGRYIYRGDNPDNYICLGDLSNGTCPSDSLYRIISTESDGTLKVIKNTSIGNIAYDTANSRSATYCNYAQYGCNVWGSSTTMYKGTSQVTVMPRQYNESSTYALPTAVATLNTSINGSGFYNNLSSKIKGLIVSHYFNNGPLAYVSGQNISTDVSQEAAYKWKGNVGLMNATDFVRTSMSSSCTNIYAAVQSPYPCKDNNWLFLGSNEWTLSPRSGSNSDYVWIVDSSGQVGGNNAYNTYAVRPVFYLSSDIVLSGKGTNDSDVYTIS